MNQAIIVWRVLLIACNYLGNVSWYDLRGSLPLTDCFPSIRTRRMRSKPVTTDRSERLLNSTRTVRASSDWSRLNTGMLLNHISERNISTSSSKSPCQAFPSVSVPGCRRSLWRKQPFPENGLHSWDAVQSLSTTFLLWETKATEK